VVASGLGSPTRPFYADASVVFGDLANGAVYVLPESGGAPATIASGQAQLAAPIADGTYAYWARAGAVDGGTDIVRAPLDGSGATQTILAGTPHPALYAVVGSKLFFSAGGKTFSIPIDGGAAPSEFLVPAYGDTAVGNEWSGVCPLPVDTACFGILTALGQYYLMAAWQDDVTQMLTGEVHGTYGSTTDQKTAFIWYEDLQMGSHILSYGPYPWSLSNGAFSFTTPYGIFPQPGSVLTASACGVFSSSYGALAFSIGDHDYRPLAIGPAPAVLVADIDSNTLLWNDPDAGTLMRAPLQ
jgi:hypothetical protein